MTFTVVEELSNVGSDSRAQESRDEILQAATALFARRGFHETSMSEVAREAKVSKALIFWHFKTKEELFLAVLGRLLQPYVIDFAEERAALDEKSQILRLLGSYVSFVRDNAESIRFFIVQLLRDEKKSTTLTDQVPALYGGYRALLTDLIRLAQEKGLCTRRLDPATATGFLLSTLNGLLIGHLFLGNEGLDMDGVMRMLGDWLFGEMA
jgi:AcrR family transcriptional regulator